jgi:predicted butyrate kinase (DUF1464 family)
MADGLAGGQYRAITDTLELGSASGTVLDYLIVIDRRRALQRLEQA